MPERTRVVQPVAEHRRQAALLQFFDEIEFVLRTALKQHGVRSRKKWREGGRFAVLVAGKEIDGGRAADLRPSTFDRPKKRQHLGQAVAEAVFYDKMSEQFAVYNYENTAAVFSLAGFKNLPSLRSEGACPQTRLSLLLPPGPARTPAARPRYFLKIFRRFGRHIGHGGVNAAAERMRRMPYERADGDFFRVAEGGARKAHFRLRHVGNGTGFIKNNAVNVGKSSTTRMFFR